ncbi:hypothetical protein [Bordetella petrii]|uniref:hypothetical protein n=1 Tax=Bordetella petrii TaxID=94624 RepID=UPI0037338D4B
MSKSDEELDRYIELRPIGSGRWSWRVSVPNKGYKNCEEWAPTRAVALEEARDAVRQILAESRN